MQVLVLRDACCAQDDQLGPLDASFNVSLNTTLGELISAVVESNFLQFSSSHVTLQGEVDGTAVVRVFSSFYLNGKDAEFFVSADQLASTIVGVSYLRFRFVFE